MLLRLSLWVVSLCFIFAVLHPPKESHNAYSNISNLENEGGGRVLLLTAHPDDECMFFAPTITALISGASISQIHDGETSQPNRATVYSLCMSIGDADSLGHVRREELDHSLDVLGIPKSNRWVLDHPNLKDNLTAYWSPTVIADVLERHIVEHRISSILTFDEEGISNHPNHKSLVGGVLHFLKNYRHPTLLPPRLFTLTTVPVAMKYTGIVGALLAKYNLHTHRLFKYVGFLLDRFRLGPELNLAVLNDPSPNQDTMPVFVSGISEYGLAIKAMWEHASQLVWFRYLYVAFSRYMWVNEWVEVRMPFV